MALFNSQERLSSVFADEAMVHVNWEEPNRLGYAGLGWSFTGVPATTSTPSEYIMGVLNKAIRAVQWQRWVYTIQNTKQLGNNTWKGEEQKTTMQVRDKNQKGEKLRRSEPVKAKIVAHTKENFRLMPDVTSKFLKEWGKSLAASNHDKNSVSTTGEKLNISDLVF